MNNKCKHNGKISLWKFMFSIMILALHLGVNHREYLYNFEGGSIAVDFFFIVSGYLFCKKCLNFKLDNNKNIGKYTFDFFWNKVKSFLPYVFFLCLLAIPYAFFINNYTMLDFERAFFNLLFIPIPNNSVYNIFAITWYLSAMIIVETFIFPLILKFKENFIYIVSPIIVYFIGNYLLIKFGNIADPWQIDVFCYKGILRAFFGINLGLIIYIIKLKFETVKLTKFSKIILTIVEILGYLSIFVLVNKEGAHFKYDYLMVIILAICILISFSEKAYLNEVCNNKLFYFLEKISLTIYLNQWVIIEAVEYFINRFNIHISYYYELIFILLTLIVLGIIELKFIKYIKSNFNRVKSIFIESNNNN